MNKCFKGGVLVCVTIINYSKLRCFGGVDLLLLVVDLIGFEGKQYLLTQNFPQNCLNSKSKTLNLVFAALRKKIFRYLRNWSTYSFVKIFSAVSIISERKVLPV